MKATDQEAIGGWVALNYERTNLLTKVAHGWRHHCKRDDQPANWSPMRRAEVSLRNRFSHPAKTNRDNETGTRLLRYKTTRYLPLIAVASRSHVKSRLVRDWGTVLMEHALADTMELLQRTPAVLDHLLRGLPEKWTGRNEGAGTWSVYDVVGHLIHAELTDWLPRVRMILRDGEAKSFEPFDRTAQFRESEGASLLELLDRFAALRAGNMDAIRALNLEAGDMQRRGRHPALGVVTLSELLATWAAHDLTHLHQISRVMAYQYRDVVGPWRKYLGVLHCDGHSAPG